MNNPLLDLAARLVIAHRGNRVAAPENTMPALEEAEQLGADALEFDVRTTRDGVPVLMHDATVDRTTTGHGRLDGYALGELQALDAARTRPAHSRNRVAVPTLEQVLDRFRSLPMVIEIKDARAIEPATRLVRSLNLERRVIIGSSEVAVMNRLYATGLDACASMHDALRLIPYALFGGIPPKPRFRVLSVTPSHRGIPIPVLRLAAAARRVQVPTQVWTVNDAAQARRLWAGGVAGIITDDPGAMLRARAQPFGDGG
jgi:glycerophosphoryl diester phosphodiesterase